MKSGLQTFVRGWLPYVVGALLVVQFAGLGIWQISRGLEKSASRRAFDQQAEFTHFVDGMALRPYQRLAADGIYDAGHQFLLDNIILNSRYGHYVLTPLVPDGGGPVLIVNRGWVERPADGVLEAAALAVPDTRVTVRGRVGSLPKAGYRMGAAIEGPAAWPQHAVFPTLDELAAALGRDVRPFVLLMDPQEQHGLLRYWVPEEMGPGRHYAYALQWLAMGAVLAGLLVWNFRKRGMQA